jgi:hypothetical protein
MNKITTSITALALTAAFSFAAIAPASADQAAATRNEIIGGLALVAGIATAINVSNKNAEANAQYGYNGNNGYYGNGYVAGNDRSYQPAYNSRDNRSNYEQRNDRRWTQNRH